MQLIVLNEAAVCVFNYWQNGIRYGMQYADVLYACYRIFSLQEQEFVYKLAHELINQSTPTCITYSEINYTIWIDLRSPLARVHSQDPSEVALLNVLC